MATVITDRRRGINSGAAIKVSCICATTADITLSGEQTIDGITTSGTRVLVKNQTDATEIGIYLSGASAWTREPDFDGTYDVVEGTVMPVSRGTVNAATWWRITNIGDITIGTTAITVAASSIDPSAIQSDGSVSYAADFLPATTATHDLGSKTVKWEDIVQAGDLVQLERADHSVTPAAGYGGVWTKSEAPTTLMFSDDAGADFYVSPRTITSLHIRAGNTQLDDSSTSIAAFDVDSAIAKTVWESIGPTGSIASFGADNEWAALDALPSQARILKASLTLSVDATTGDVATAISAYGCTNDEASPSTSKQTLLASLQDVLETSGDTLKIILPVEITLDANQIFKFTWNESNGAARNVSLDYRGFISD